MPKLRVCSFDREAEEIPREDIDRPMGRLAGRTEPSQGALDKPGEDDPVLYSLLKLRHGLAFACLLLGCAPTPAVPAADGPGQPAESATPQAPPAQTSEPAAKSAPACITQELRERGRVAYAGDEDGGVAFCVVDGYGAEVVQTCLQYDVMAKSWSPGMVLYGREFPVPGHLRSTASAERASAAGTLTVCVRDDHCATVQIRPARPDARDEVYGSLPAIALDEDRVLVASSVFVTSGAKTGSFRTALEIWDVKRGRRVKQARLPGDRSVVELVALGKNALIVRCEDGRCDAGLVDPATLAISPLEVRFDRWRRDQGLDLGLVQPVPRGGWALFDAHGTLVVWVDNDGKITRRQEIDCGDNPANRAPHIGRVNESTAAILPPAPLSGTIHLIDLDGGQVTTVSAPICAVP